MNPNTIIITAPNGTKYHCSHPTWNATDYWCYRDGTATRDSSRGVALIRVSVPKKERNFTIEILRDAIAMSYVEKFVDGKIAEARAKREGRKA